MAGTQACALTNWTDTWLDCGVCANVGDTVVSWGGHGGTTQLQRAPGKPSLHLTLRDPHMSLPQSPLCPQWPQRKEGGRPYGLPDTCGGFLKETVVCEWAGGVEGEDFYLLLAPLVVGRVFLLLRGWRGRPAPPASDEAATASPCAAPSSAACPARVPGCLLGREPRGTATPSSH